MSDPIYLDHAAATPLDPTVLASMQPYFSAQFYNPSATYLAAQAVHKDLEAARSTVAHWLGARSSEIVFTAGGSEGNNLVIHGIMSRYPEATLVVSAIEHESVLASAQQYNYRELPVDAKGVVDIAMLEQVIDDRTVLVSVMYANNEVGSVQPIRQIAQKLTALRAARRKAGNSLPLLLHTDAAQAANYLDLHVARLGVDLMTLNGGKIYGPKQSGAVYVRGGIELTPLVYGGGQERGLRSGTENVAGSIGFAMALATTQTLRHQETERLQQLQAGFIKQLQAVVPEAVVNGSLSRRLPNNVHVSVPGQDNERLLFQLDAAGILAAAGSACSADSAEPSHVLRAMGLSDDMARASLRFTMGRSTTEQQLAQVAETLARFIA